MKALPAVLVALTVVAAQSLAVEGGQVTLPLDEFLERGRGEDVALPGPPIAFAVTRAEVDLKLAEAELTGVASFAVTTFADGWHLVPLIGGAVNVVSITPDGATVVGDEGRLALLVEGKGRREVGLEFASGVADGERGWEFDLPAAVAGAVRVSGVPAGRTAVLTSATARVSGTIAYLTPQAARLRVELTDEPTGPAPKELPKVAVDSATIPRAEYRTRIVADGSLYCEAAVGVRHRESTRWRFRLPEGSQLLACTIDGEPASPGELENGDLELPLAAPRQDGRSLVGITYTASAPAFDPVRGDFRVTLPWTPLFVEEIDWRLALPGGYEASAFEGNVEVAVPADSAKDGELHFQKHLARGEAAAVQIFYTKSQLN